MEDIDRWLQAVGADGADVKRELLRRAVTPSSEDRAPLVLPDPQSAETQAILALLAKGQVPTSRAVAAGAATAHPVNPRRVWSDGQIDHFGRVGAAWVHDYRRDHGIGPTRSEFFSSAAIKRALVALGISDEDGNQKRHRDRDYGALMVGARRRGWLAWSAQTRSLCSGTSFFGTGIRSPDRVGRRISFAVRQFRLANDGRDPTWEQIADVRDATGNDLFRTIAEARAQSLWLFTEQWIVMDRGRVTLGPRAIQMQNRNLARQARQHSRDD